MNTHLTRRAALIAGLTLLRSLPTIPRQAPASVARDGSGDAQQRVADLEKRSGGRLGVAMLDIASHSRLHYRAEERFAMCSTFKFVAAGAILQRIERGQEKLDRWIAYGPQDLLEYAPVTRQHVQEHRMRLADICAAAVEWSDNTAANLMLREIGGPAGFTQYCRSLGDRITRLDRTEPELNRVAPGDVRDTTTPAAMLSLLNTLLLGKALATSSRQQLESWMVNAKVGKERVPAGLPPDWRIGHKTGTGRDETNDVAIAWPPGRAPVLITAFYSQPNGSQKEHESVLREVGHIVASAV